MPAYIVAICEITNPNENFKKYSAESARLIEQHGGRYVVRGPAAELIHGQQLKGKAMIITEFPDLDKLNAFLNDEEYVSDVMPLREGTGHFEIATYAGSD